MELSKLFPLLLLLIILVPGCSQKESSAPESAYEGMNAPPDIPIYSGSEVYQAPAFYYQITGIPTEGVTVYVYYTKNAGVDELLRWYKQKLGSYEIVDETTIMKVQTPQGSFEWGGVIFKKGDRGIGIWAISGSSPEKGGCVYYIVEGPLDVFTGKEKVEVKKKTLPLSDRVSGEEILERYPGSVMLEYEKSEGFPSSVSINYGTQDPAEKVFRWYEQYLTSKGWEIKSENKEHNVMSVNAAKNGDYVDISIYSPTSDIEYTQISVHATIYQLPPSDIAKGEEPVKRYPGSVMLDHTSATYGNMKMITTTYGSHDSPEKIKSWYQNELTGEGWQIVTAGTSDGKMSIFATRQTSNIQIEISRDGYTEIDVIYQGAK